MSKLHIHLDAIGGVAGDMFIAAMCDAFPDLREAVLRAQRDAGLPADVHCRFVAHRDHALTGTRFEVDDPHEYAHRYAHAHGHDHHHDERPFAQICAQLRGSPLKEGVVRRAIAMFTALAEVEGRIHGVPTQQVSFHELGGWDSIADIVGAAAVIESLDATWSVSALPLGRGRVRTAHGELAVPAPATTQLLAGYAFIDDGREGERVTPTGAAILRHFDARQQAEPSARKLIGSGHGFGTRTFPGLSNVLRVLAFEAAEVQAGAVEEQVAVIAFAIDDQTPEDLAIALDRLRAHDAVLDVLQIPAFGKKGRMSVQVEVLARVDAVDALAARVFSETTTLGLRWYVAARKVLQRAAGEVNVGDYVLRTKVAQRDEGLTAKVESDDLRKVTGGHAARERTRRRAEEEGLKDG